MQFDKLPGVKPEEVAWSGVKDWLKGQTKPVTKAALADYLRANELQVSEVVKIKRYSKLDALVFLGKHFKLVGDDNDGVNAFANALADRLNAAKRRVAGQAVTEVLGTVPGTPPAHAVLEATDARIIEPQPVPVRAEEAQPSQGESRDQLW
mgnify:CR=1 FL=1